MIAVFFALPQESRGFIARLRAPERRGEPACPLICGELCQQRVGVFHIGLGAACAGERLRRLAGTGLAREFQAVIAAGFAGGLDPALHAGSLVLDGATRPWGSRAVMGRIATASRVLETPREKAEFARATGALAVEMENASVSAFAWERGLPLLALRAITDSVDEALPVPAQVWFDERSQQPRAGALSAFLLRHPARIPGFCRFVRNVGRARHSLTEGLVELIAAAPANFSHTAAS